MKDLVKTTKGTVRHYKDDSMEFIPHRSATSLTSTVCRWSVCETYELTYYVKPPISGAFSFVHRTNFCYIFGEFTKKNYLCSI